MVIACLSLSYTVSIYMLHAFCDFKVTEAIKRILRCCRRRCRAPCLHAAGFVLSDRCCVQHETGCPLIFSMSSQNANDSFINEKKLSMSVARYTKYFVKQN